MTNFFANVTTIEELKKAYRKLALENHPDRGGDEQTMKDINNEYETVFESIKSGDKKAQAKKESAFDGFRDIIDALVKMEGLSIEVCGNWIWIDGKSAYPYKKELGKDGLGFKWASGKKMWYWHNGEWKKVVKRPYTMDEIRETYGSETVETEKKTKIEG